MSTLITASPSGQLIEQLSGLAQKEGLQNLATRLADLHAWIAKDLADFENELDILQREDRIVVKSAHHLLDLGGKHLRPMCVLLANKIGKEANLKTSKLLATAVEWIHAATLLHDDVVDMGEKRRGKQSARMIYGNAASIFAGDWLLVKALQKIREAKVPGLLDKMLKIIDEMIIAESVQLENRGRINGSMADYFHVVEGKTAALFRWAMYAGAKASQCSEREAAALEDFGLHLGVAFQLIDDLLDVDGDVNLTGKELFADLREGKMTYPILVAVNETPQLMDKIEVCASSASDQKNLTPLYQDIIQNLTETGALGACRALAKEHIDLAIAKLDIFEDGPGKNSLVTVANASIRRHL